MARLSAQERNLFVRWAIALGSFRPCVDYRQTDWGARVHEHNCCTLFLLGNVVRRGKRVTFGDLVKEWQEQAARRGPGG